MLILLTLYVLLGAPDSTSLTLDTLEPLYRAIPAVAMLSLVVALAVGYMIDVLTAPMVEADPSDPSRNLADLGGKF